MPEIKTYGEAKYELFGRYSLEELKTIVADIESRTEDQAKMEKVLNVQCESVRNLVMGGKNK